MSCRKAKDKLVHVAKMKAMGLRDVSTLDRAPRMDMTKAVMPMVAVEIIIPKSQGA